MGVEICIISCMYKLIVTTSHHLRTRVLGNLCREIVRYESIKQESRDANRTNGATRSSEPYTAKTRSTHCCGGIRRLSQSGRGRKKFTLRVRHKGKICALAYDAHSPSATMGERYGAIGFLSQLSRTARVQCAEIASTMLRRRRTRTVCGTAALIARVGSMW